ncbi:MAG: translation initiation factor [Opitutales bacterium]
MSRKPDRKIPLGESGPLEQNPFAGLDGAALPAGDASAKDAGHSKTSPGEEQSGRKKTGASLGIGKNARVEVRRETAGRGGKTVTTLRGFPSELSLERIEELAAGLKKECACGGTCKEGVVELQGDVCTKAAEALTRRGFRPVRAGG